MTIQYVVNWFFNKYAVEIFKIAILNFSDNDSVFDPFLSAIDKLDSGIKLYLLNRVSLGTLFLDWIKIFLTKISIKDGLTIIHNNYPVFDSDQNQIKTFKYYKMLVSYLENDLKDLF